MKYRYVTVRTCTRAERARWEAIAKEAGHTTLSSWVRSLIVREVFRIDGFPAAAAAAASSPAK